MRYRSNCALEPTFVIARQRNGEFGVNGPICVDNGGSCGVVLKLSNRFFGALAGARFFFGFRPRLLGMGKQWVGTD